MSLNAVKQSVHALPLQVTVGALCASYWRGAWYILDYSCFPDDRVLSACTCLGLGALLLGTTQTCLLVDGSCVLPTATAVASNVGKGGAVVAAVPAGSAPATPPSPIPPKRSLTPTFSCLSTVANYGSVSSGTVLPVVNPKVSTAPPGVLIKCKRFAYVYGVALSCVLVWRGAWLLWDEGMDRVTATKSHVAGGHVGITKFHEDKFMAPLLSYHHDDIMDFEYGNVTTYGDVDTNTIRNETPEERAAERDPTLLYSGLASHLFGTVALLAIGRFVSVVSPPAAVSVMKDVLLHAPHQKMHTSKNMAAATAKAVKNIAG